MAFRKSLHKQRARPKVEGLEDRALLADLTSLDPAGLGTILGTPYQDKAVPSLTRGLVNEEILGRASGGTTIAQPLENGSQLPQGPAPGSDNLNQVSSPAQLGADQAGVNPPTDAPSQTAPTAGTSATVLFSQDEQTVTVRYQGSEWTLARPVVSPWDYTATGRVYWVASDGHDYNWGTYESPFRSISQAVAMAGPGDIVYIRAGTYVENLLLTRSGEEGKPIIISCAPGDLGKVKVTPSREYVEQNPDGAVITVQGANYVWINGLVIEGSKGRPEAPESEHYGANGITWSEGAGLGDRATNNVIYNNVHCGLKEMHHGGTGIFIEGNVIFGNGTDGLDHGIYAPADDMTINGNIIFNNAGYGIHSYESPVRQVITRNIIFGHKESAGIILAGSENQVFNNVVVGNYIGILYFRDGCTDNVVMNNIFSDNVYNSLSDDCGGQCSPPTNNVIDYNAYFSSPPSLEDRSGGNDVVADPLFVNKSQGDFRLRADSPLLGKGVDVGLGFQGDRPNLGAW
jgi:parallel beta-helix repeat protein